MACICDDDGTTVIDMKVVFAGNVDNYSYKFFPHVIRSRPIALLRSSRRPRRLRVKMNPQRQKDSPPRILYRSPCCALGTPRHPVASRWGKKAVRLDGLLQKTVDTLNGLLFAEPLIEQMGKIYEL